MLRATAFVLAMVSAFSAPALAAGLTAVQSVDLVKTSVDADGANVITFEPATDVAPGEQVRYSLQYTNEGDAPAEAVSLVMPVPAEMTYLEESISGAASVVTFSVDAGTSFAPRQSLIVVEADIERAARAEDITHIKWTFSDPIAPASSGAISFMAVLK